MKHLIVLMLGVLTPLMAHADLLDDALKCRELRKATRYAEALTCFEAVTQQARAAQDQAITAVCQYNIALTYERLLRLEEAVESYQRFLELPGAVPGDQDKARAKLKNLLAAHFTRAVIQCEAGFSVGLKGRSTRPCPARFERVRKGPVQIRLEKDGAVLATHDATAEAGQTLQFELPRYVAIRVDANVPARVELDGTAIGATPVTHWVGPGSHQVTLSAASHLPQTRAFSGNAAQTLTFQLKPEPLPTQPSKLPKILAWSAVGVSAAALGVGAYFWAQWSDTSADVDALKSSGADSARISDLQGDADDFETFRNVALGAGGALALTAVVLFIVQPDEVVQPSAWVGPGSAGITVRF